MRFCAVCDNMMYLRLRDADPAAEAAQDEPAPAAAGGGDDGGDGAAGPTPQLRFYCKNCGNSVDAQASDARGKVLDTDFKDNQAAYSQYASPFIEHDRTLPRVSNIPCALPGCTRPGDAPNEVIYVKYDATNLRFLYYCVHCKRFWKTGDAATPVAAASAAAAGGGGA